MKSTIIKRSIVINGHKTSISMEDQFWAALKSIAAERNLTTSELVSMVHGNRESSNLSSALRVFCPVAVSAAASPGRQFGETRQAIGGTWRRNADPHR